MVLALLHDSPPGPATAAGIHGLAEITAMTTPPSQDLVLTGLKKAVLAEYFARVGRGVFLHLTHDITQSLDAIAVYAESGFAPILAGHEFDSRDPKNDSLNHAMVAVGVRTFLLGYQSHGLTS